VLRPSSLPHALTRLAAGLAAGLATGVLVLSAAPAPAAPGSAASSAGSATARKADAEQPLVPRIRSITPDYVPAHGPIVIRGTVTNTSDQTWTAINVHGFMGTSPITTSAELAAAAQVPVDADVGHRITVPGTFASISHLAPGASASFRVRLPRSTLPLSSPGVYWFGVHVLGDNGQGGPRVAVGRDRTFLPYVPDSAVPSGAQEDTALVIPIRAGVVRADDGTVIDPETWGDDLRSGQLHDVLETGLAAQGRPLTWLVDPAVLDVVRRLAHGNPPRSLVGPVHGKQGDQTPSTSAGSGSSGASGTLPTAATRRLARQWLRQLRPMLGSDTGQVLGLPYGDLAVEPAVTYDPSLLRAAFRRSAQALHAWGLAAESVVAPPDGRTTGDTISGLPHSTEVLLADAGVSRNARDVHTVNHVEGHRLVLDSTATAQGGPGPVDPRSSLALRQRILSEAALRLLEGGDPLVLQLPAALEARIRDSFFSGLDVPWLRLTTFGGATAVPPTPLDAARLRPPAPSEPHFGLGIYTSSGEILDSGRTLQSVLTDNHVLHRQLFEEVAGDLSYASQREPLVALARMRVTDQWVRGNLDHIGLAAPPSVTLASTSGRFSVLVSNDLDVPVTVQVRARSDADLKVTGGGQVKLAPHGQTSVLLHATTHQRGVHSVTLELTSTGGRALGVRAQDQFPMRAEQVSNLIWVIIGAGVALLFAAIAVRLTRRVLRARAGRRTGAAAASKP
jgi:hypothetical protein